MDNMESYVKQNFVDGDVLSAEPLNNMDDQIESLTTRMDAIRFATDEEILALFDDD